MTRYVIARQYLTQMQGGYWGSGGSKGCLGCLIITGNFQENPGSALGEGMDRPISCESSVYCCRSIRVKST